MKAAINTFLGIDPADELVLYYEGRELQGDWLFQDYNPSWLNDAIVPCVHVSRRNSSFVC